MVEQNCSWVDRILVGNKCDDTDRKAVLTEDAKRFADYSGIQLFETSAKENINVDEVFRAIIDLALKSKHDRVEEFKADMNHRGCNCVQLMRDARIKSMRKKSFCYI